jgi:hypothetical protein
MWRRKCTSLRGVLIDFLLLVSYATIGKSLSVGALVP